MVQSWANNYKVFLIEASETFTWFFILNLVHCINFELQKYYLYRNNYIMKILFLYLVLINYIAFSLYHLDKERAIKGKRRISEKNLLTVAAFGGTLGAWIGMNKYRHKTKKLSFKLWFYTILILQVLFFFMVYKRKFLI